MEAGDEALAEQHFRAALALQEDLAEALVNLAYLLENRQNWAEAERCYRRALQLEPGLVQGWLNLGALLQSRDRPEAALPVCREAVTRAPRFAQAWSNLGAVQSSLGLAVGAEHSLRTALALQPDYPTARFNLSYLLLGQGRLAEGWECFESRPWVQALATRLAQPRWQGEALAGRRLLVVAEGGYGDALQFCRYLPLLAARGGIVTLWCHPGLEGLLAQLPGVDEVLPLDRAPPQPWDLWVPLMSLPRLCGTTLEFLPDSLPYLRPDPARVTAWAGRLPAWGLRVGLVWQGNPRFENDWHRSLPGLSVLAPLAEVAGVSLVSLQKGAGEGEAACPPPGMALLNLGPELKDFSDTAAVIAGLDLVISVDTAVAHLAGALGKPCWLLLPHYKTDWRWLQGREDTPWYPGVMRLFRQPARWDWASVVARVKAELALAAPLEIPQAPTCQAARGVAA